METKTNLKAEELFKKSSLESMELTEINQSEMKAVSGGGILTSLKNCWGGITGAFHKYLTWRKETGSAFNKEISGGLP